MDFWNVLFDILLLLSAALVLGVLCERFRQSPILGYLAAGTLLGPNALQFISSSDEVSALAELGVALLLFTIGLEFSWSKVKNLGIAAFGGGVAQVLITLGIGALIASYFELSFRTAIVVGAIVALSSTACVLRLLISRAEIESIHGRNSLGILLIQDMAVVPLVLLVTVLSSEGSLGQVAIDVLKTLFWGLILIAILYLLLNRAAPRILGLRSLQLNRDLPILLAIVTGLGSAWAAHQLNLSPALGAFVAGMILAESPFATQIRGDISSIRTLLVTLFFSSIGTLGDPAWFIKNLPEVLSLVLAIVIGKAFIIWMILRFFRLAHASALAVGICLAQVGEFAFVLAAIGQGSIIDESLFKLIISATIITLFLTPYLIAFAPQLSSVIIKQLRKIKLISYSSIDISTNIIPPKAHIVIIGFGPAGQAVGQTLKHLKDRVLVVDLSPNMIQITEDMGLFGYIGDATHADVLNHVNIASASTAVVTVPDPKTAYEIVKLIKSIAPNVHIIARVRYHPYLLDMQDGGADEIVDEEELMGVRLAAVLRRHLRAINN